MSRSIMKFAELNELIKIIDHENKDFETFRRHKATKFSVLHGVFESGGKNGLGYPSCQSLIALRDGLGTKILKGQNMAVFHKDPCGVICLLMTYSAVLYADYCLVQHVIIPTLTDR